MPWNQSIFPNKTAFFFVICAKKNAVFPFKEECVQYNTNGPNRLLTFTWVAMIQVLTTQYHRSLRLAISWAYNSSWVNQNRVWNLSHGDAFEEFLNLGCCMYRINLDLQRVIFLTSRTSA